jgi:hypothetical protein
MRKLSSAVALFVTLWLIVAGAGDARAQEDSGTITTVYQSVLESVTGEATSAGIGWAMSAIGLAGGGAEVNDLNEIVSELQAIDTELNDINTTLGQILNAVDNLTCVDASTASALQTAINNINNLYNLYQQKFIAVAAAGNPVDQNDVDNWMNGVLNIQNGVGADLTSIYDAVYASVNSSVLLECITSITQSYNSGAGPSENIFDDRPYYTTILNTVNYYYAIQVTGAALLVEALHLQACQQAALSDPDLNCDFTTVSTSTPASEAYEICNDPTGDVATTCQEAQEAITDPQDPNGALYQQVLAEMIYAGAPYSNHDVGLLWGTSDLFPKDLKDFTNEATVDGNTVSDCSEISSGAPCGFLVGSYDLTFNKNLTYAGYPGDGESSVWKPAVAEQLLELLGPYNENSTAGNIDTSGSLSDYLKSIGFGGGGIGNGLIITTADTGKNKSTDSPSICFMDTSIARADAAQPFCDDIEGEVESTDALLQLTTTVPLTYVQAKFTEDLFSQSAFYTANNEDGRWQTMPGWTVDSQETTDADEQTIFWQFHYPVLDVTELNCSVRSQGDTNPGGEYTMCGSDLQAYIDAIMPPPDTGQIALTASADTTPHRGRPNTNDGANPVLGLGGGRNAREIVLRFSEDRIRQLLGDGELIAATLRLSQVGKHGRTRLAIRPLTGPFVEGNGNPAELDRGMGTGATWNCAEDADISDHGEDCLQRWSRSTFDTGPGGRWQADRTAHYDWRKHQVSWDVSEDLRSGVHAWLIRTLHRRGRPGLAFHSREGAAELRDPGRAPTLLLER